MSSSFKDRPHARTRVGPPSLPSWVRVAIPAALFLVTCFVFLPSLRNGFTDFDDDRNLTGNLDFRGLGWARLRWMFTTFHLAHYQPLSWLSLSLDYTLWGMNPFGYHLTSLLLHASAVVLCFYLALALIRRTFSGDAPLPERALLGGAAVAALFFGLHPLRVESVAWVTERRDVLSAPLLILAVLAWLRSVEANPQPRGRWLVISLVCYTLSLLSKSIGMTFPAILLVLDVYPLRRLDTHPVRWLSIPRTRAVLLEKIPYLVLSFAAAVVAFLAQARSHSLEETAGYGPAARLMVPAFSLVFPLLKTVLPFGLLPLYPRKAHLDPAELRFVLGAVLFVAAALGLLLFARRRRGMLAAAACYAILLLPVLGFVQIGVQVAADRFSYLPSVPLAILLGAGLARWLARAAPATVPAADRVLRLMAIACLAGLALLSWRQCRIWKDAVTLWDYAISVAPEEPLFHNYRGLVAYRQNDFQRAAEAFREALRLDPKDPAPHTNLGMVLAARGADEEAIEEYEKASALASETPEAHHNWGLSLLALGRTDDAIEQFAMALHMDPTDPSTRGFLAQTLAASGRVAEALETLESGIPHGPARSEATDQLVLATSPQDLPRAETLLLRYANRYPADPWCRHSLALVRIPPNRQEESAELFATALSLDSRAVLHYVNLSRLCLQADLAISATGIARAGLRRAPEEPLLLVNVRLADAILALRANLAPAPNGTGDARALLHRAAAALEAGRKDEAAAAAESAMRAVPGLPEARWLADIAYGRARDPRSMLPAAPLPAR